jgi:hypothetical protein
MATISISQAEAERDLHSLLARVSEDISFLIENDSHPVAMLQAPPPRTLSFRERIALLPKDSLAMMDDDFARDVEGGILAHREPIDSSLFDE